jgi:hypothetical protein
MDLDRAPRSFRCRACKSIFLSRAWRRPRYCSIACSNRGRDRQRAPVLVARDGYILELHGQGLKSPQIQEALARRDPAWWATPALIRKVISLEMVRSRANIHTAPVG